MSNQEISAERLAELFHHYHQVLGPNPSSSISSILLWEELPKQEQGRFVAAARLALLEIESSPKEDSRRYFAKPGEAEWGC
ncbi:MAG: hypothetical protein QOD84_749 [Acidobacteriaceae bacterium]|jgi:hypothetical protein|nr:hypothetical protein [Acidobacteriaceae bacterium]